jgi:hypothetical protein
VAKNKNDKTNPIQKSITHYTEMINLKIAKSKQTQTNPFVDNFLCGYVGLRLSLDFLAASPCLEAQKNETNPILTGA